MLKILNGARLAKDTSTGDIYVIDSEGAAVKLTDTPKLSSIAITTEPTKTTYVAGELFDTTGMVLTATYDNGATAIITNYTYIPDTVLTTADTKVVVTYESKAAEQAITVNES